MADCGPTRVNHGTVVFDDEVSAFLNRADVATGRAYSLAKIPSACVTIESEVLVGRIDVGSGGQGDGVDFSL